MLEGSHEERHFVERLVDVSKERIFSVAVALNKVPSLSKSTLVFLLFIETLQILSFAFSPNFGFEWGYTISWLSSICSAIRFDAIIGSNSLDTPIPVALFAIAVAFVMALVAGVVALMVRIPMANDTAGSHFSTVIRFTHRLLTLTLFVLYLPLLSTLIRASQCSSSSCNSIAYQIYIVGGAVCCVLFIPFTFLVVAIVGERAPKRDYFLASPHTHADLLSHLFRTIIVVGFSVASTDSNPVRWILTVVYACCTIASFLTYLWFIPFFRMDANFIFVSCKAFLAWSGIAMIITQLTQTSSSSPGEGALVFLVALPGIIALANFLMKWRYIYLSSPERDVKSLSPYEIEMKIRFYLQVMDIPHSTSHFSYIPYTALLSWLRIMLCDCTVGTRSTSNPERGRC